MAKRRKSRRLETIQVNRMTYRHLCEMAFQGGLEWPGQVVDKMVRAHCIGRQETERRRRHEDPR